MRKKRKRNGRSDILTVCPLRQHAMQRLIACSVPPMTLDLRDDGLGSRGPQLHLQIYGAFPLLIEKGLVVKTTECLIASLSAFSTQRKDVLQTRARV